MSRFQRKRFIQASTSLVPGELSEEENSQKDAAIWWSPQGFERERVTGYMIWLGTVVIRAKSKSKDNGEKDWRSGSSCHYPGQDLLMAGSRFPTPTSRNTSSFRFSFILEVTLSVDWLRVVSPSPIFRSDFCEKGCGRTSYLLTPRTSCVWVSHSFPFKKFFVSHRHGTP